MRMKVVELRKLIRETETVRWRTAKDGRRWRWVRTAGDPEVQIEGEPHSVPLSSLRDRGDVIYSDIMGGHLTTGTTGYTSAEQ